MNKQLHITNETQYLNIKRFNKTGEIFYNNNVEKGQSKDRNKMER